MHELEERIREAFESHPDMMGGLLAVYALGKSYATDREDGSGDPLDCPGCGYDPMAPHNGKGDCAPNRENGSRDA